MDDEDKPTPRRVLNPKVYYASGNPPKTYRGFICGLRTNRYGIQVPSTRSIHGFLIITAQEAFSGGAGFDVNWREAWPEEVREPQRTELAALLAESYSDDL